MPCLTSTGPCEILFFEAIPGGPLDVFEVAGSPQEHLARTKELLAAFLPWEAERAADARLTDAQATLTGRLTPTVRRPIGRLRSGRPVLGLADAVVLNDPITGQGANSAAKSADAYLHAILDRDDLAFDEAWMVDTFERVWEYQGAVTGWTNMFLGEPAPHVGKLLGAAGDSPDIASRIADGFNHPPGLLPYWQSAEAVERLIADTQQAAA
jgi:2-polyprenyl-6-methoxyphenol hydroxylase-like FAD-dependent oxidoreductase